MKSKESIGFWKSKRQNSSWYISNAVKKCDWEEMPKNFRIILRQNKYWHSNEDAVPRFIAYFVDGESAKAMRMTFENNFKYENDDEDDDDYYDYGYQYYQDID